MRLIHRRLLACAKRIFAEIEPRPETPERIAAAEARLGRALPPGYRSFLEEVGSVALPIAIGNVIDFVVKDSPWPDWFVPFADDGGGNHHGFDLRSKKRGRELPIDFWDHEEPALEDEPGPPQKFEAWLEEQVRESEEEAREEQQRAEAQKREEAPKRTVAAKRAANPSLPAEAAEDDDGQRARELLRRLRESGQIETTRGFDSGTVADAIADAGSTPEQVLDILLDRQDVIEVYASEEEIAALQQEIAESMAPRGKRP